jgi:hypothetical protein
MFYKVKPSKAAASGGAPSLARSAARRDEDNWVRRPKAENVLAPVWERTLSQLGTYDLPHLNQDVLKGIYQELVDPKDR